MNYKQAGISLVETMVGLSIAAGISLVLMRQQDTSNKMQAKVNADQNISSAVNIIQASLANRAICTMSLRTRGVNDGVSEIIDAKVDDADFNKFTKTGIIADSSTMLPGDVKIDSMKILEEGPDGKKQDYLLVVFNRNPKEKKKLFGSNQIPKKFRIQGKKDLNGKYVTCYSEASNLLMSAVEASCLSLGGSWNPVREKCEGLIRTKELVPVYMNASGVISTLPPEIRMGDASCRKNHKACNRTEMDCSVVCPPGQFPGTSPSDQRERDVCTRSTKVFGTVTCWDEECWKDHYCVKLGEPSAFIVKPISE